MELSLCSIDYSISYEGKHASPILHLFCRDENFNRKEVLVEGFIPYFYINKSKEYIKNKFSSMISSAERGYVDYVDNSYLIRINAYIPPNVGKLRKILEHEPYYIQTFEADILFPLRYLIDKEIYTGVDYDIYLKTVKKGVDAPTRFRVMYVDIETFTKNEEDYETYLAPIIVYGIYDSLSNKYYILTQKEMKKEDLEKYLLKESDLEILFFETEVKLLLEVRKLIRKLEPDIILTFSPFDMKYTIGRMKELGIKYRKLSPMNVVRFWGDSCKISGVQIMDISEMYRTTLRRAKWDTLEFIANKELNVEGLFHDQDVSDMWESDDYKNVIIRNLRDVEMIKLLDEELQLITYFDAIRRVAGCNLRDTLFRSRVADILDLRNAKEMGYVLPTRRFYYHCDYKGARVFRCLEEIWKNILVVDFTTMYPSIIRTLNLGFHSEIPGKFIDHVFIVGDLEDFIINNKEISLVIQAFNKLEPLRKPFKLRAKKARHESIEYKFNKAISDGLKSLINAEYGKFGYSGNWNKHIPAARLYEPRVAAIITAVGRKVQGRVFDFLKKEKYVVPYGDTDSIFIEMKTTGRKERDTLLRKLNNVISKFFKETFNSDISLNLEFDKYFTRLLLLSKKRYVGKREDGTFEWKGIEQVRRDQSIVTVEIQEELIKRILNDEPKELVQEYFLNFSSNFKKRKIEEIAIPLRLTKKVEEFKSASYHLKAFVYSRDILKIPLEEGKRFYLLYIKEVPENYPSIMTFKTKYLPPKQYKVEAIAFNKVEEIPNGFEIDVSKMKEKTIINKSEDILSLLDLPLEEIKQSIKGYKVLSKFR